VVMTDPGRVPLSGRAWISDGSVGALVAADGTIDWYCPDGFDHPASFYRLLDPRGGALRVGAVRPGSGAARRLPSATQSYLPGTMVAVTETAAGAARLRVVDLMSWSGPSQHAPRRLVRVATALAGRVEVEVEVVPGEAWRPVPVWTWSEGAAVSHLLVRCGFPLLAEPTGRDEPRWRGVRSLDPGESMVVTVDDARTTDRGALSPDAALRCVDATAAAWRSWLRPLCYSAAHRESVERSVLLVRSLGPAGAPLAAGTTSLPRRAGGERTAEGRVAYLRDAATAAGTLAAVGLVEDAEAAEAWLRRVVEAVEAPWPTAFSGTGEPLAEHEQLLLAGWRRSQPVVSGLAPSRVDLDVYGDVIAAVSASQHTPDAERSGSGSARADGPLAGAPGRLADAADWVADHWSEPDVGVWALAGEPRRLSASAAQAWLALDRSARRVWAANPLDLAGATWYQEARRVRAWLETEARCGDGSLGWAPGEEGADAALLRIAWRGPWPATDPIVAATVDRILERNRSGPYLYRLSEDVDDGRPGPDSPDLLASLWAVRAQAALGRWEDAHERMEAITGLGGRLGLLSDTVDPTSGALVGNLPAAAVHLAVIEAARALASGPV
jgi:GH15 family glucan-1,4-alpha-glucosidase